jgi:murein DD-endopeptidase
VGSRHHETPELADFACVFDIHPHAVWRAPKVYNSFALRATSRQITPAHHNGSWELVYEIHIVNCSKIDLTLRRLEVLEAQSGKLRMTLDDVALADVIGRMDRQAIDAVTRIPPGVKVIAYMTAEWSEPAARSITLKHRLTYSTDSDAPSIGTVEGGDDAPVVLGPPLRGGDWTPIYSDMWKLGHRRVMRRGLVRVLEEK